MPISTLYNILSNKDKKITIKELYKIVCVLEEDASREHDIEDRKKDCNFYKLLIYSGEQSAYSIVLKLFEHLDELLTLSNKEQKITIEALYKVVSLLAEDTSLAYYLEYNMKYCDIHDLYFYSGKQSAYSIVRQLFEHLDELS